MEQNELEYFRNLIQHQLMELTVGQARTRSEMISSTERLPDVIDHASTQLDRSVELKIRDRERKLIAKLEEALLRIDEGLYGICEECGAGISAKRLVARPVTSLCVACKTKQEKSERLREKGGWQLVYGSFGESSRFRPEYTSY